MSPSIPNRAALRELIELLPIFRERIWGRQNLQPFFSANLSHSPIGEVWFTSEENPTNSGSSLGSLLRAHPEILGVAADPDHPGLCPLLIKLLFTSERLSVQVHPDDEYARTHHRSLGKTEAWHVLASQPPGEVAVGFRETLCPERMKAAAESGEIADLLNWCQVNSGDTVSVPAGTVHAIGAGLTVYEVQQNSDITYRLYDYGRPRELHLHHGTKVSDFSARSSCTSTHTRLAAWRDHLLDSAYFRLERLRPTYSLLIGAELPYYLLLTCIMGVGIIGREQFAPGRTWLIPAGGREVRIEGSGSEWLLSYRASEPTKALSAQ